MGDSGPAGLQLQAQLPHGFCQAGIFYSVFKQCGSRKAARSIHLEPYCANAAKNAGFLYGILWYILFHKPCITVTVNAK